MPAGIDDLVQRSLNVAQRAGAVFLLAAALVATLILFNPWRQQLASLNTAAPAETTLNGVEDVEQSDSDPESGVQEILPPVPTPTPIPTASPTPLAERDEGAARSPAGHPETAISFNETPLEAATALIDAAIAANDPELAHLMERAQPLPEASFRVWRRLERCQGIVSAGDLDYRVMVHYGRFASIFVFDDAGRYLGDIKLWLDQEGVWYLSTMNYSSFTALKHDCRR